MKVKAIQLPVMAVTLTVLLSGPAIADEPKVTVYKSPTCGCCVKWAEHMEENGFEVETVDMRDLRMIKSMSGVSPELSSCHTARVDGYVIEGHVPASDIRRLLKERPAVKGLAVPHMPEGSPGMEGPNPQPYAVLMFDDEGNTSVFANH